MPPGGEPAGSRIGGPGGRPLAVVRATVDDVLQPLARLVLAGRSLDDILADVTTVARRGIPGTEAASITLIRGEKAFTVACDGHIAVEADELQYDRGHGPCMDAARAALTFVIDDMRTEARWPDYTARAAGIGVRSSLSVPLPVQASTIGALNCYSTRPEAFDDTGVARGEEVASFVAVAVANAEAYTRAEALAADMRKAMQSRAVIDQAIGVLMAQQQCSDQEAFALLTKASQRENRKLRDIASGIVAGVQRRAEAQERR